MNDPVARFASLFKSTSQLQQDENAQNATYESARGREFGAYPLFMNGVSFSSIRRDQRHAYSARDAMRYEHARALVSPPHPSALIPQLASRPT